MKTLATLALVLVLTGSAPPAQRWGITTVDEDSITMMAGALDLENQPGWRYLVSGDSPEGGYFGTLPSGLATLQATVKLPKPLAAGRYSLFFKGVDYDGKKSIRAALGGGVSTPVVLEDRDATGLWTERAILEVVTPSETLQLTITGNGGPPKGHRYFFRGLYVTSDARATVHRTDVVVKLSRTEPAEAGPAVKGNLVVNGGFETGVDAGWGFDGAPFTPVWDATQAFEGQASLKIADASFALYSRVHHLKPNRRYSLSAWVKSAPGASATVTLSMKNTFVPPPGYPPQAVLRGTPTPVRDAWTRVSVTGELLEYPTSDYQIVVSPGGAGGSPLWIDALQLEEGDLTDYRPASDVDAGVVIDPAGHLFYGDEPLSATVVFRNHSAAPRSGRWRTEAFDFMNRLVGEGSRAFSIPAATTQRAPLDLSTGGRTGIFRLVSWIENEDRTERETVYAVIPRPPTAGPDPSSYLGIHPNYVEAQLQVLQRLGMKWGRVMSPSAFFRWSAVEPQEGTLVWHDAALRLGAAYGLTSMGTIGTNNYWPKWADAGGLPDLDKWQTFVGKLVEHYKPFIKHWEIWNEPGFAPDFYAQMLKRAADAVKEKDPTAKVVGIGGLNLASMDAILRAIETRCPGWDWKKHVDILSTHDYPGGVRPEDFRAGILDKYGVPVWNTETGAWDHGFYQGPNSNFVSWGKNLWPTNDARRYYDGMLGAPVEVAANFLRTIASGQTKYFYYDSRIVASPNYHRGCPTILEYDGTVRPKGIAYAIAGSLIDHAVGLGNVSTDPGCFILLFDRPGGAVAALFSADRRGRQISLDPAQVRALDLMGNPLAISGAGIPFGRAPVYVRASGLSAEGLKKLLQSAAITARKDAEPPHLSISEAPRGLLAEGTFRVRWIAVDDASFPNLGEINPESRASSDVPNPHAILYRYRLQGRSADWSPWTAQTYTDFNRLPPGSYAFEVQARDEAGNECSPVVRPVTVRP